MLINKSGLPSEGLATSSENDPERDTTDILGVLWRERTNAVGHRSVAHMGGRCDVFISCSATAQFII